MSRHKVSITDIAKKTGLSTTTVSRVINGKGEQYRISEASRKKIMEAVKEMRYVPNIYAANLRTGKSNTVALMVPSLNNPFFASIVSGLNAEIRKYGYITIISDSDENFENEKKELEQLIARNIEGLIIVPTGNQWRHIKELYDQQLPIICVDRYFEELDLPYVATDNYDGAFHATKCLINNGHVSIACIQGVRESTPNRLRVKGFKDALEESGISSYWVVGDDFTIQNGYLETKLLMQQKDRPTAIFALSNTIAMGCMKALKEENIRIPQDVSIITFDEHPYLDFLSTPLSYVAQPVDDIIQIAVKYLFSRMQNKDMNVIKVLLKPQVVIKESIKTLL
ncbi:LacI family DNA-binding transcriptional regulator [Petrimonas mucosa]|jgi:LacI family transcriptional regulator|uniref:LacI family DNA-binding transcriptional regulator n=1 Tax=Petrimonas mucosa TaxID=1642646 RepID=UPI0008F3D576|nr:LacI family DNA-binding transcriptional regulator [Petrimonas mucosa]MDD3561582.1 LacI family DNA-binding transcriptional regulator [Petrimonas mucosa]SFU43272.1 transcriptional regulator, LacI family [Porphyromonadaceae bacterium KHP3R9]